ncbi:hypothetical protein VTJ49DRAFT_3756 [Mycothermus thermophilus]|uniref:non-specific serine/threonine protein kinase n=1 Tax=Humicola insolens TaxID=85995 RepID=A0ABR3V6S1_HUMIN
MAEPILPLPRSSYTLYKPLSDGLYLVRRTGDGELLLARPLDVDGDDAETSHLCDLIRHGGALAAANLLNHENLVSIYDEMVELPAAAALPPSNPSHNSDSDDDSDSDRHAAPIQAVATQISQPSTSRPLRFLLWDYADQGTLQDVLDAYHPPNTPTPTAPRRGVIPESFIWHVSLSLLSALQYLHQGRRDVRVARPQTPEEADWDRTDLVIALGPDAAASGKLLRRFVRVRYAEEEEEEEKKGAVRDWWPVLHRDVSAKNVFLQRPRGTETYGAVKLGGFGRCFVVSGAVGGLKDVPMVAPEGWEEEVSVAGLRERLGRWKRDGLKMDRSERPYTQGSDLFAVGKLVYHMMFGTELPPAEECPGCECVHVRTEKMGYDLPSCPHDCVGDVDIQEIQKATEYSVPLRILAKALLLRNRDDTVYASQILDAAWSGYLSWVNRTADGRLYRDEYDDMWFRQQNKVRFDKRRREEEHGEPMQVDSITPSAVL